MFFILLFTTSTSIPLKLQSQFLQKMRLLFLFLLGILYSSHAHNHVFNVGESDGWTLKPSENYSHWAQRNRFQINDELVFKYKNGDDSVLVVREDDYNKCNKRNPIQTLLDANGYSKFKFHRSGPFFFISGHDHNCENGQKFIVVVIADRHRLQPPQNPLRPPSSAPSPSPPSHSPSSSYNPSAPVSHSPSKTPSHAPSATPIAKTPTHAPPTHSPSPSPTHAPTVQPPSHSSSPSSKPMLPPYHAPSPSPTAKTPSHAPPTPSPSVARSPPVQPPSHSPSPSIKPTPPPYQSPSPSPSPTAKGPAHASPPAQAPSSHPSSPPSPVSVSPHSPPPAEGAPQPHSDNPEYAPVFLPPNLAPAPAPSSASGFGGSFIFTAVLGVVATVTYAGINC